MLHSLMLKLGNSSIPPSNGILKPLNLNILQTKASLKTLGQVYHLVHVSLLEYLVVRLGIHISDYCLDSLIRYISNQVPKVCDPEQPLCISSTGCWEQTNRVRSYLLGIVLTKSGDTVESCFLKSIHKTVPNHLNLNRWPLQGGVLRNGHFNSVLLNSILRKLASRVLGWIWVVEDTKSIPKNPWKTLPVQTVGMSISLLVPKDMVTSRHLNQKDSNVSYMIISRLLK